jgi:putative ABC transport system permease protein
MYKNYFKIAVRNLLRFKGFSAINIIGLSVGMACCFLILLFVRYELSFDKFQEKYDRIYRIAYNPKFAGIPKPVVAIPPPASPLLVGYFPEIEQSARIYNRNASIEVERNGQNNLKFEEQKFFFADSTILDIFTFKFLEGNPKTALNGRFNVILTDEMAQKYFGKESALGKTILFGGMHPMKVSGVVEKYPDNSHIKFNFISDYETMFALENPMAKQNLTYNWVITHSYTYVLLKPNQAQSVEKINAKFPEFINKNIPKQLQNYAKDIVYTLQPMQDFHLSGEVLGDPEPAGSMTTLYIFIGIAVITLLIACINFVNLSTARSLKRAKEVSMRKVLGAIRGQLIGQFLGESILLGALAFALAFLFILAALPYVNTIVQRNMEINLIFQDPLLLIAFVSIFVLTTLLAGSYPAFFISKFKPTETLKGNFSSGKARGGILRQSLLVLQFTASIVLIIGSLVVFQQVNFMQNMPLGFKKDLILNARIQSENLNGIFQAPNDSLFQKLKSFSNEIKQNANIQSVALSNVPLGQGTVRRGVVPEGFKPEDNLFIGCVAIDYSFIDTYGLKIVAGRNFSEEFPSDVKEGFILNEFAIKTFGWKTAQEAIGKQINREGKQGKVVGVVQDFHAEGLSQPLQGVLFDILPTQLNTFSIKVNASNVPETLAFIEQKWNTFFPEKAFEYAFLDESLAAQYEEQQRLGKMVSYFAGLAIFISCLGLFGLISLVTQQKIKEVGIRKVLGASIPQIVYILSRNFAILVLLAFLIASPIAYYFMNKWLSDFAFKIELGAGIFIVAGISVLLVALLTMSFQTIKAALENPVKALRTE